MGNYNRCERRVSISATCGERKTTHLLLYLPNVIQQDVHYAHSYIQRVTRMLRNMSRIIATTNRCSFFHWSSTANLNMMMFAIADEERNGEDIATLRSARQNIYPIFSSIRRMMFQCVTFTFTLISLSASFLLSLSGWLKANFPTLLHLLSCLPLHIWQICHLITPDLEHPL